MTRRRLPSPGLLALLALVTTPLVGSTACTSTVMDDVAPSIDGGMDAADATAIDSSVEEGDASADGHPTVDADRSADADAAAVADTSADTIPSADTTPDVAAVSCNFEYTSTIPHVRFAFATSSCTFTLAQARAGISIPYDLVVDAAISGFVPAPSTNGSDAANLTIQEMLTGNSQQYCVCDTGRVLPSCPAGDGGIARPDGGSCDPVTIPPGVYRLAFAWDGHNWNGPSDTSNPKGVLFPAGDYELAVTTGAGTIGDAGTLQATGKMRIHLVP